MRRICIKELDSCFNIPLRSASTLLDKTFHKFILCKNYTIEDAELSKCSKNFVFVRNPIDRFFSTYYFFNQNFNEISNFIDNFKNVLNTNKGVHFDPHYLPQKINFLPVGYTLQDDIENIFITQFNDNYNIVQIESIDLIINECINIKNEDAYNFDFSGTINFLLPNDSSLFIYIYIFFKKFYDVRHHSNIDYKPYIKNEDYMKIYEIFEEEMNFYNYRN